MKTGIHINNINGRGFGMKGRSLISFGAILFLSGLLLMLWGLAARLI